MSAKILNVAAIMLLLLLNSCEKFVELDTPKSRIVRNKVFENDAGVRAAVSGIFSQMMSTGTFAGGSSASVTVMAGLSSDELINYSPSVTAVTLFNNSLTSINNSTVTNNWNDMFLYIYDCNSILEGTEGARGISPAVKNQVVGEARFVRAFTYFYLVNLFGDVPILLSTDYRVNMSASRNPTTEVYQQIETDLLEAQKVLLTDYSMSSNEKVEPNKWAATALLARAYLYQKKWTEAEAQSTAIIDSKLFSLVTDLNSVFLKNSSEAIWQLMPSISGANTPEASYMIITANPTRSSLTTAVTNTFEPADKRQNSWVGAFTTAGKTYKYAFKYKVRLQNLPVTEYYMILRLAEQYLIRAEARAMQNNLAGAAQDVNIIRTRAGLSSINVAGLTQSDLLAAIDKERRTEFFAEWGNRWFDLKRSGNIDAVLGPVKPDWQSKDALFPIPQADIVANPNLVQNP